MMEIFHYCNLIKFESILNSKKLWLTPVQTMNDGTEVDHLYNIIWPKVKEKIITEMQSDLLDDVQHIFNLVDGNAKLHVEDMPYCVCFSDNGDLLSQWCRYAEDGTGVSIGFNSNYFKIQHQLPHPNIIAGNAIGIGTVVYDYDLQISILSELVKYFLKQEVKNASIWLNILGNLTRYSAIFKNQSFFTEHEKRIIYYFANQHTDQLSDNFLSGPYKYVCKNVEYSRFELSWFNSDWSHAITRVFLGPKCQCGSSEILKQLNQFGIQIDQSQILKSASSYR